LVADEDISKTEPIQGPDQAAPDEARSAGHEYLALF
jgi:hypothetical protein